MKTKFCVLILGFLMVFFMERSVAWAQPLPENTWVLPLVEVAQRQKSNKLTEAERRTLVVKTLGNLRSRRGMESLNEGEGQVLGIRRGLQADILSGVNSVRPMGSISMPRKIEKSDSVATNSFLKNDKGKKDDFTFVLPPSVVGTNASVSESEGSRLAGDESAVLVSRASLSLPMEKRKNVSSNPSVSKSSFQQRKEVVKRSFSADLRITTPQVYIVRDTSLDAGTTHLLSWGGIGADVVRYERHLFWGRVGGGLFLIFKWLIVLGVLVGSVWFFRRDIVSFLQRDFLNVKF